MTQRLAFGGHAACADVPVIRFICLPLVSVIVIQRLSLRCLRGGNGFLLRGAARRAGEGLHPLCGTGGRGGHGAVIPDVTAFHCERHFTLRCVVVVLVIRCEKDGI